MAREASQAAHRLRVGVLYNAATQSVRGEEVDYISAVEVLEQKQIVEDALERLGFQYQSFVLEDGVDLLISALRFFNPDVVVNLCEGAFGDSHLEMNVACLLELLGIAYTGSPPLSIGVCQNKGLTKDILRASGIPTPGYQVLNSLDEWGGRIAYPLFVKPLKEDASLGISRESLVSNDSELRSRVEYLIDRYKQPALVEEYVEGRELNVSILGNETPQILPISEIVFRFSEDRPKIVDYAAKWIRESEEYRGTLPTCPADLERAARKKVEKTALKAYKILNCRDYARVDIRLRNNVPYVLEVNPNPDISPDGGLVRSLKAAGIPFEEFVQRIVFFALERKEGRRSSNSGN